MPPQQIKATDSRAAGFRDRFGVDAATIELDARESGDSLFSDLLAEHRSSLSQEGENK